MATSPKNFFHYAKYLALLLILVGIPTMLLDKNSGSEIPLVVGLFILLVTKERTGDERSAQIKTTSLYVAFIVAYGVKLLTSNFYDHALISFKLEEINHFIILVLSLANVIFYARLYYPSANAS